MYSLSSDGSENLFPTLAIGYLVGGVFSEGDLGDLGVEHPSSSTNLYFIFKYNTFKLYKIIIFP